MRSKLGEILIKANLITHEQLDDCLKSQVIFGGKLGTNLIELGYLAEEDLAAYLSRIMGVPAAPADQIMSLPSEIISVIPRELVEKYKVVPLSLDRKRLTLAMMNPSDIAAIDEISFITGLVIMPVVAPELRILCALEKYYDIRREKRYISFSGGNRGRQREGKGPIPVDPGALDLAPAATPLVSHEEELAELIPLDDFAGFNLDDEYLLNPGQAASASPQAMASAPPVRVPAQNPLEELAERLAVADDRDDIAAAIMDYAGTKFGRCAMLIVKGAMATGWTARFKGTDSAGFGALRMPLDAPSVVKMVVDGKNFYLGPIPETTANRELLSALGGGETALLVPLLLMGKVVAILYVEGGAQELSASLPELKRIVVKASMAFEILILRTKILAT